MASCEIESINMTVLIILMRKESNAGASAISTQWAVFMRSNFAENSCSSSDIRRLVAGAIRDDIIRTSCSCPVSQKDTKLVYPIVAKAHRLGTALSGNVALEASVSTAQPLVWTLSNLKFIYLF